MSGAQTGLPPLETFMGMRIVASPYLPEFVPTLKLNPYAPVTDEFRAEFNKWLLDMFGERREFLMVEGRTIVAHPNSVNFLRQATKPHEWLLSNG